MEIVTGVEIEDKRGRVGRVGVEYKRKKSGDRLRSSNSQGQGTTVTSSKGRSDKRNVVEGRSKGLLG